MAEEDASDLLIFKLRDESGEVLPSKKTSVEAEPVQAQQAGSAAESTGPEAEEMSPEGMHCAIHPWREAYAVCNRCGLPFCYVDIVKRGGRFVCLDDIGKEEAADISRKASKNNFFTVMGGIMLVFTAAALIYFFYPQAFFIYKELQSSLTSSGIMSLFSNYYIQVANLAAFVFSLLIGIYVIRSGNRYVGIIVGFLVFMLISYEYLNTGGLNYLILIMAVSFISIILFVLGNMSAVRSVNELIEDEYRQIDWPRPEVF